MNHLESMEKYSEAKIYENNSTPRNDSVNVICRGNIRHQSQGVSYDCKYVLADIRDSSGLYVKSIILQINFYA